MKRREERRQRERDQLPAALMKLLELIPSDEDARSYLTREFADITQDEAGSNTPYSAEGSGHAADTGDAWIYGRGLEKLLSTLGEEACPDGAFDVVRITRRVPRNQSTINRIHVAELCFALSQVSGPVSVHERRRAAAAAFGPLDEMSPLLQYYRGSRFGAIVRGEDPSSPAARHAAAAAALSEENSSHSEITSADSGKSQKVDSEWPAFVQSISTPLPMTLRVHRSERVLEAIAIRMLTTPDIAAVVRPVAAFPSSSGLYSCRNSDYHSHKRVEYVCRTLHTASAVSFQEVVSAIPLFVLDVHPQHTVLDLCAAPGSKTVQALDSMLCGGWSADTCRGVLIANEKDRVKATQTLPARLKRYHAPNVMTTRCDGVQWPRIYMDDSTNPSSEPQEQKFDRIICDVPCSGDGTIRKERSVATTWSASYVKSLVPTQQALLCRGLDLLATGGILVYSTCSMNPKEDEEVVCIGLETFGDNVELIDVNAVLQQKGFHLNSAGGILSPNVEAMQHAVLPPTYDGRKVLRVLPHRDDTGGFFVAAFRKVKQPAWTAPTVVRHKLNHWMKGKLWAPVGMEDEAWVNISTFYGFDRHDEASFVYYDATSSSSGKGLVPLYHLNPNGGPMRRIVLSTPALAEMVLRTRPYKGPGVEVVSVGVRAFEAYDGKFLPTATCRWRAVVESASFLAPRFTARRLHFRVSKHKRLLEDLLRNGHIYTKDHWRAVLGGDPAVVAANANPKALVKPGTRLEELLTQGSSESSISDDEVEVLLTSQVEIGCVLVGIISDEPADAAAGPWYVSATLSGRKLEIAIDGSLRAFGLMALLGIHGIERASLADNHSRREVADEGPEGQAKEA
ncbi:methyltransferase, putative [Leishmania tarentolae]|uniref:Methyltransferase, putative n=1 Tax=Leishmania tarentolae TaxID=5689 RepID=A0A640KE06_LEITA|nr:methyltransferase, putative [Leishmania tarentolae]